MTPPSEPDRCGSGRLLAALAGAVAVLAVAALAGLSIVEFGLYDARAVTPHDRLTSWIIHTTFIKATRRMARTVPAPAGFSTQQKEAGLQIYVAHCEACHGGPATPRASWVAGVNPTPPYLLDTARRWTPAELHMIIADGVKLTAMPAWRFTLPDAQIWDLVAFLEGLPSDMPAQYLRARSALTPVSETVR